jgi:hypothetical protein
MKMATVTGTGNGENLSGSTTNGDDIVYALGGDDTINAKQGNDIVYGGEGNDTIQGGNDNDTLYGDAGNDILDGGNDNDVLIGGEGDDQLTGGNGADTFVFNFTVTSSMVQKTVLFRDGNAPSTTADYKAWLNYDTQLDAWRAELSSVYGVDLDATDTFAVDITVNGGSVKKPVYSTVEFSGDNSYTYFDEEASATIEGEGYDTVLDWSNGADKLALNGLSNTEGAANYWGNFLTSDDVADDGKTVISFDGGSITLIGTDMSIADLVTGGYVLFG